MYLVSFIHNCVCLLATGVNHHWATFSSAGSSFFSSDSPSGVGITLLRQIVDLVESLKLRVMLEWYKVGDWTDLGCGVMWCWCDDVVELHLLVDPVTHNLWLCRDDQSREGKDKWVNKFKYLKIFQSHVGTNLFFLCSNKEPESHSGTIIGELSFLSGGVVTGGGVGGLNLGWWWWCYCWGRSWWWCRGCWWWWGSWWRCGMIW